MESGDENLYLKTPLTVTGASRHINEKRHKVILGVGELTF